MKKILKCWSEFGSIINDPRWLEMITISGFSSRKVKENKNFIAKLYKLIEEYNSK